MGKEGTTITDDSAQVKMQKEDQGRRSSHAPAKATIIEVTGLSAIRKRWHSLMDIPRGCIAYFVLHASRHAASHPVGYIVGILILSFVVLLIGLLTNFDMNTESSVGYTPFHSVINEQKDWILEESNFPPKPHSIRILIHKEGASVASRDGVLKAFEVIRAVEVTQGYQELCDTSLETNEVGYSGLCQIRGVPLFWNNTLEIFEESVLSDTDLLLAISAKEYPDTSTVEPMEIMGHIAYHRDTYVIAAESFLMEILIPKPADDSKGIAVDVLGSLLDLKNEWIDLSGKNESSNFGLEVYFTDYSLEAESLRAVFKDLPLIPAVFVIMTIFTCLVFSFSHKPDGNGKCKQRLMLGFGAVATVCLSMAFSYGILYIIGTCFVVIKVPCVVTMSPSVIAHHFLSPLPYYNAIHHDSATVMTMCRHSVYFSDAGTSSTPLKNSLTAVLAEFPGLVRLDLTPVPSYNFRFYHS